MKLKLCELCDAAAVVFCPSDSAFLCWTCDAGVHEANFIVARHVRQSLCSVCNNRTGRGISGVISQSNRQICSTCLPTSDGDAYSSCSSDCISSTTSPAEKKRGSRRVDHSEAENIFVGWCGKLGVDADVAVRTACEGLRAYSESWTILPFRVCLAASMWFGLRLGGEKLVASVQVLKRLEEVSGVPARVIVAAELKLERGLRRGRRLQRSRVELEEGWAEC